MKRPGRPDLPCVYGGMHITVLLPAIPPGVHRAKVTKASGGRVFRYRRLFESGARESGDRTLLRREYRTQWVKGWDGREADAFRAVYLLMKD